MLVPGDGSDPIQIIDGDSDPWQVLLSAGAATVRYATATSTSSPGIGDSRNFDKSGGALNGIAPAVPGQFTPSARR